MKKILIGISCLLLLSQCNEPSRDLVLDVKTISSKTPDEVVSILGKPDSTYTQHVASIQIYTQLYKKYDLEIQYLPPDKLSKDIIFRSTDFLNVEYDTNSIAKFGFTPRKPTEQMKNFYMKWYDYEGFRTINFYATSKDTITKQPNQYQLFFKAGN